MSGTMNDFQKQLLEEHNKRRQQHGIPPLQWDHEIARQTQQWANKMAKEGKLKHSQANKRNSLGENIASNSKSDYTGNEATQQWYSEIQYVDWNNHASFNPKTGHFTQMIWKSSQKIGAAISTNKKGSHFVCARYDPAGNMAGEHAENVLPPKYPDGEEGQNENETPAPTQEQKPAENLPALGEDTIKNLRKIITAFGEEMLIKYFTEQAAHQSNEDHLPCQTVKVDTKSKQPKQQAAYLVNKDNYLQYGKTYSVTHYVY